MTQTFESWADARGLDELSSEYGWAEKAWQAAQAAQPAQPETKADRFLGMVKVWVERDGGDMDAALAWMYGDTQPAQVPAGWKLVPIEPTADGVNGMVNAGAIALQCHDDTPHMNNRTGIAKAVYRAMIAAAPEAKP
jgi:hypothetical protein